MCVNIKQQQWQNWEINYRFLPIRMAEIENIMTMKISCYQYLIIILQVHQFMVKME
jgi:hypothetical protein